MKTLNRVAKNDIMALKQMKRFFLIVLAIFFAMGISAQESASSISADRPGMATGVDVMPFKSVQWETGFQYDDSSGAPCLERQCRAWRSMDDSVKNIF